MRRYARAWFVTTASLVAVGLVAAVAVWTFFGVVGAFLSASVVGGGLYMAARMDDAPVDWRGTGRVAAYTGASVVATLGLGVVLGPFATVLLLAAAVSSPPAVRRVGHWLGRWAEGRTASQGPSQGPPGLTAAPAGEPTPSDSSGVDVIVPPTQPALPAAQPAEASPPTPEALDIGDLCRAWRASFDQLEHCRSLPERLEVVRARQAYLDELERRNPDGLAAWLAAGARAAGDPSLFMRDRGDV